MWEFIQLCFQPVNLPFSILLILAMGYWLLVIAGFGIDALDFDIDVAPDIEMDADADMPNAGGSTFSIEALRFFHLGDVPLMIVVSFFAFNLWAVSLISNYYLNDNLSAIVSLLWFGPNLLASLILAKLMTMPLVPLFRSMNRIDASRKKLIGSICLITTGEVTQTFGQAEVQQDGPPIVLNVRVEKGDHLIKGDGAEIVAFQKDSNTYLVRPLAREK